MINTIARIGSFTSSEICALLTEGKTKGTFGKPALTYIEETNMERKLGRSLCDESNARPLTWGKLLEVRAFELLGLEYSLVSKETVRHPAIDFWSGSPDGVKEDTVIDIKCPVTLKSFCQLVDPLHANLSGMDAMNAIRNGYVDSAGLAHAAHKDGDKFYWQLVSNSILTSSRFAELIVYVPYFSELPEIKVMAQSVDTDLLSKHYWIAMATDHELPYLVDGGYYKNLNIIRFEVPESDKEKLTAMVLLAGKSLIDRQPVVIAEYEPELEATIIQEF